MVEIINYLDIFTLLQAEKEGRLIEELEYQRTGCNNPYSLSTESYCMALLEMEKTKKIKGLSADDVKRKVFHSNF